VGVVIVTLLLTPFFYKAYAQNSMPVLKGYRKKIALKDPFLAPDLKPIVQAYVDTSKNVNAIQFEITSKQAKHMQALLKEKEAKGKIQEGYRVQLLSGDRNAALQTKFDFLEYYPEVETYMVYEKPYFRVRVGNFISRSEAEEFCKEIKNVFPAAVIIRDQVFR
jgi:hypothetical protein